MFHYYGYAARKSVFIDTYWNWLSLPWFGPCCKRHLDRGRNKPKSSRSIWATGIKKLTVLKFLLGPNLFFLICFVHQVLNEPTFSRTIQDRSEHCVGHTFVIKWTFYLQKVKASKVTLGILFYEHSVQVSEKIKVRFVFAFLENTCFVCNSMGKEPIAILKHLINYFPDFGRKWHTAIPEHN